VSLGPTQRRRASTVLALGIGTLALLVGAPAAQAALPAVGAVAATEVGSESALLSGNLNPNGLATSFHFEYATLAAFSEVGFTTAAATPSTAIGSGILLKEARAAISGLTPDTTYYYRLSATNASGTANGKASTFSTSHGIELACEGDDCQILPPPPVDPTLTTLLQGLGNPAVRYHRLNHRKKPKPKKHHKPKRQTKGKR
jgi:phosphodiesterase/alkaline phosphatase D-like protein